MYICIYNCFAELLSFIVCAFDEIQQMKSPISFKSSPKGIKIFENFFKNLRKGIYLWIII